MNYDDSKGMDIKEKLENASAIIIDTNVLIDFFNEIEKGEDSLKYQQLLDNYDETGQLFLPIQVKNEFLAHCNLKTLEKTTKKRIEEKFSTTINNLNDAFNNLNDLSSKYGHVNNKEQNINESLKMDDSQSVFKQLKMLQKNVKNVKYEILKDFEYGNKNNYVREFVKSDSRNIIHSWKDRVEQYEWIQEGFTRVSHNIPPAYIDSYVKKTE